MHELYNYPNVRIVDFAAVNPADPNELDVHLEMYKHSQGWRCSQCPEVVLRTRNLINTHIVECHSTPHQCKFCKRYFLSTTALKSHKANTTHSHQCENCSKVFLTPKERKQHQATEHKPHCKECNLTFADMDELADHKEQDHIYECPDCDKYFHTNPELQDHINSPDHTIHCNKCENKFCSNEALRKHNTSSHTTKSKTPGLPLQTKQAFPDNKQQIHPIVCSKCGKQFDDTIELQSHHLEQMFNDTDCKTTLVGSEAIESHQVVDIIRCPTSGTSFNSTLALVEHAWTHCSQFGKCGAFLESEAALKNHKASHYVWCAMCPDVFDTVASLQNHTLLKHRNNVPQKYKCFDYIKDYGSQKELTRHIIDAHFLRCKECPGLRFSTMQELSDHSIKVHVKRTLPRYETKAVQTTEYRCDECVTIFEDEDQLDQHIMHHPFHGKPELFCTECCIGPYKDQIELLKHIESKPHQTKWVLSMI